MELQLFEDIVYKDEDYSINVLAPGEYDNCKFNNCNFSSAVLSEFHFLDCCFTNCNFSLAVLSKTRLQAINFIDCKLMGVDFSVCNDFLFEVSFKSCQMDYCSFYQKKMKKTVFTDCSLKEVDFTETNLSLSTLLNCDLQRATFRQTNLDKADFRTAFNYSFDPGLNNVKKTKFSSIGIKGLLEHFDIIIE